MLQYIFRSIIRSWMPCTHIQDSIKVAVYKHFQHTHVPNVLVAMPPHNLIVEFVFSAFIFFHRERKLRSIPIQSKQMKIQGSIHSSLRVRVRGRVSYVVGFPTPSLTCMHAYTTNILATKYSCIIHTERETSA